MNWESIQVLDILVGGAMALSLALGMWRGLTHEVLSLLGWVLAFYLAQTHADQISPWLPIEAQGLRMASAFVLVMVMALIGVAVVMWMAKALINVVGLGWLDRILGGLFGLMRACLLLLAATAALAMTPLQNADWWRDSHSGPLLSNFLAWVKPLMPIEFGKYLP